MPAENTPMKSQYNAIKAQHPDCLLFFRLGDFYEMFDEDAVIGSKELELALTTRDRGRPEEERTPMCGVPYHSAEQYISRLIQKGYKVAVCEQLEDPRLAKGIVKRDVIRIISPGTVIESSMLTEGESNYLAALFLDGEHGAGKNDRRIVLAEIKAIRQTKQSRHPCVQFLVYEYDFLSVHECTSF